MNPLADKVHKQGFNSHPYISSSKFSADWRATATSMAVLTLSLCVKVLGWLEKKKKERKEERKKNEQFCILTVSGRPPTLKYT